MAWTFGFWSAFCLGFFGVFCFGAEQHQQLANVLNQGCASFIANGLRIFKAGFPVWFKARGRPEGADAKTRGVSHAPSKNQKRESKPDKPGKQQVHDPHEA
ncbi:hypothetical protein ACQE8V_29145, partial [Klebsiella pneumoniae]